MLNHYLRKGFATEDDLDFYIQEFLGYVIPRQKFCPEHVSPWQFLTDFYFERVKFGFVLGSRASGKTFLTALLDHLNTLFRGVPVGVTRASATLDQAQRAYSYFLEFFGNPLLEDFVQSSIQSRTRLTNGSELTIVAGTLKGLNGPHTPRFVFDEVEVANSWDVVQEGLSIAISKNGVRGQSCFASTRKKSGGIVTRLLDEAEEKNMAIHNFCLSGETVVRTPNGDTRIRDLIGQELYVYSVSNDGELVLRKASNIRKTRQHAEVFEVVYEWFAGPKGGLKRGSVVSTPDHHFMLSNGGYKQVQDLKIGDSLMPFSKRRMPFQGKNRGWHVGFTGTDSVKESIFTWEQLHGELPAGYVVHHEDGNDYNNTPTNLEAMLRSDHSRQHTRRWFEEASDAKKKVRSDKISVGRKAWVAQHPEFLDEARTWWDRVSPERQNEIRELQRQIKLDRMAEMSEEELEKQRQHMLRVRSLRHQNSDNHKVVAIHQHGYEDVYCMDVEETHNFAANDIFVHNCVFEVLERCTRSCQGDPDWGDCPIYNKCKGRAHDCNGWFSVEDFIAKSVNLSTATFETQWENKSPSGGPKVYGEHFDERTHVLSWIEGGRFKSFKSIFGVSDIPKEWRKVGGMDFGANFAFLCFAVDPRYDIWVTFFEYFYNQDRLLDRHAAEVKKCPQWSRNIRIYSDPSAKQEILEMRNRGLNCVAAMNDLLPGVDEVKRRLEINPANGLPKLFIMDTCVEFRREMREWEHGVLLDGKADLESFEDGNDHCNDAGRYALYSYPRTPKPHYRYASIDGL